jgi:S1-C subfamily serine protease
MDLMLESPVTSTPSGPRRRAGLAVVTALALFAAGMGIGWLVTSQPPAAAPAALSSSTSTLLPVAGELPAVGSPAAGSDEPVADVAAALLPSIVQIELPFGGLGSGVIYDDAGHILTAAHVVEGVFEVTVRLPDGDRVTGRVLGTDARNDIAVVAVEAEGLTPAPLALGETPRVGQLAVALGSPWGLDSTVTAGVVSAVDRPIADEAGTRSMIQTDAPINPGNSGGPLADRQGRVIGINVSIFTSSGASDGVGFAVPIDQAVRVAESIVTGGAFVPGYLGVSGDNAPVGEPAGALITEVFSGTPAALIGLQVGDVVVAVDGAPVSGILDLGAQMGARSAGDEVRLEVLRDGVTLEFRATLAARRDG